MKTNGVSESMALKLRQILASKDYVDKWETSKCKTGSN